MRLSCRVPVNIDLVLASELMADERNLTMRSDDLRIGIPNVVPALANLGLNA